MTVAPQRDLMYALNFDLFYAMITEYHFCTLVLVETETLLVRTQRPLSLAEIHAIVLCLQHLAMEALLEPDAW